MIVVWLSVYLHIHRGLSWRKILPGLIAPGVVFCSLYTLSTDLMQSYIPIKSPFPQLFETAYDPGAVTAFLSPFFGKVHSDKEPLSEDFFSHLGFVR
jgi:hypothetical protein